MSVKNFIPEIWSANILSRMNDVLVYGQVVNRDYEGDISAQGDTVRINEIGPVTIQTYTANSTSDITWEFLSDAQKILKIDQAKYFAFALDDVDKAQAKGTVLADAMEEAMWGLRNNLDEYIAALHSNAGITIGSTGSGKDITSTVVLRYLSEMAQKLDEANVPPAGRWTIVPPWLAHKMVLAQITKQSSDNKGIIENGFLGRGPLFYGFDVYVSNNVVNGTPAADNAKVLFGYKGSISLATQILATEAVRPAKQFIDLVKGMLVYGAKVIRPDKLGVLTCDFTDEAT